jgi:uncharacterized protein (DUF1786 family)
LVGITPDEHPDLKEVVPPAPGKGPSAEVLLRSIRCPVCTVPMERCAFDITSKTVIDLCEDHGLWFDAVELVQVTEILGRRLLGINPKPEEETRREIEEELERMRRITDAALSIAEIHQRDNPFRFKPE